MSLKTQLHLVRRVSEAIHLRHLRAFMTWRQTTLLLLQLCVRNNVKVVNCTGNKVCFISH